MLYPQLLGDDFDRLPRALRDFHTRPGGARASGVADVRHSAGRVARLLGFPAPGERIPAELQVIAGENEEVWVRRFGTAVRKSVQRREGALLVETAGPVRVFFRVWVVENEMRFQSERVRLWIIPLPLRIDAYARGAGEGWEFDVQIRRVGGYRGSMKPVP
ncbi:MAG TPA: hypothetical protein VL285_17165 [Bryobacteraceae bacterium]|nr:hypothetical protein [Bryobacteraceae bacterium]